MLVNNAMKKENSFLISEKTTSNTYNFVPRHFNDMSTIDLIKLYENKYVIQYIAVST